jgi:AmmeMemoRadiSam system protein A
VIAPLSPAERDAMLALARGAIEERLHANGRLSDLRARTALTAGLTAKRACFVTLEISDAPGRLTLRGCIGSTEAEHPAHAAVVESARSAAFEDPRFAPVTAVELPGIVISISLLTTATPVETADAIVLGRDGVVLSCDGKRALFLPEVAEHQGWDRHRMLEQLARKAGLPAGAWRRAQLATFQSERFGEPAADAARIPRS